MMTVTVMAMAGFVVCGGGGRGCVWMGNRATGNCLSYLLRYLVGIPGLSGACRICTTTQTGTQQVFTTPRVYLS